MKKKAAEEKKIAVPKYVRPGNYRQSDEELVGEIKIDKEEALQGTA